MPTVSRSRFVFLIYLITTTNALSRWTRAGADEGGWEMGTGGDKDGRGGDGCGARTGAASEDGCGGQGRVRRTRTDAAR